MLFSVDIALAWHYSGFIFFIFYFFFNSRKGPYVYIIRGEEDYKVGGKHPIEAHVKGERSSNDGRQFPCNHT